MNKVLVVDGHNVIFKSRDLVEQGAVAIDALVSILNSSAFLEYDLIFVVFDANEVVRKTYSQGRITIVLTAKTESADTVISQLIEGFKEALKVVVVSDDYSVQLSAIHRSRLRMTTKEFFEVYRKHHLSQSDTEEAKATLLEKLSVEEREKLEKLYYRLVENERKRKE